MRTNPMNKLLIKGLMCFLFFVVLGASNIGRLEAQSIGDWVGNTNLVDGSIATQRILSLMEQIKVNISQSGASIDAQVTPATLTAEERLEFFKQVFLKIRDTGLTTRNAINETAIVFASSGYPTPKVSSLVQEAVSILQ